MADEGQLPVIWGRLQERLAQWRPDWRDEVDRTAVVDRLEKRRSGGLFTDEEVFEALVLGMLSNNTDWSRIQDIREKKPDDLRKRFADFDVRRYAVLDDAAIDEVVAWLQEQRSGSITRGNDPKRLRKVAALLDRYRAEHGSARAFFLEVERAAEGIPERMAVLLGRPGDTKLYGFGVPLAAEALRNLGYDLSKPDRHTLRAVGSWELVDFANWKDRAGYHSPTASRAELESAMLAVKMIAKANEQPTTWVDSTIWTACARGGAWFTNETLRSLLDS